MSKQAVIKSGSSQFIVKKDDVIDIDYQPGKKSLTFEVLAVVDGANSKIGAPVVEGSSVKATVVEEQFKDDKVSAIRYRAKKGVHKVRGHRQQKTRIKITSVS